MCAVIRRGILGGFSNKIGNIVGTSWKGIAVMKSLPLSVANPQTAGQVGQRTKFGFASQIASEWLATLIKPLWDRFSGQMSGYNKFIQVNLPNIDTSGTVTWASMEISKGKLNLDPITTATANGTTNTIVVNYVSTAGSELALSSDLTYVGIVRGDAVDFFGITNDTRGAAGAQSITINTFDIVSAEDYHIYLAFKRADGTMVSNTSYKLVTAS